MNRPRQEAERILLLPPADRSAAIAALDCDDAFKTTVTFYVLDHELRVDNLVAWVSLGANKAERNRRLANVPEAVREEVEKLVRGIFEKRKEAKKHE